HDFRADRDFALLDVLAPDVTQATGDHDGLVIAAHTAGPISRGLLLEGPEVTADGRAAELVVERGGTNRTFDHDVQGRGDARRAPEFALPWALIAWDAQMRDGEPR